MTSTTDAGPVVLVGCGRLGSALTEGWLATGAIDAADLIILTPSLKPVAASARAKGARINPEAGALRNASAVVLAVKPAMWRKAVESLAGLSGAPVVISVMAGVRAADIADALPGCPVVRAMPTTAVAQAKGVTALWSEDAAAFELARGLFAPVANVVALEQESLIDPATAVAGSAPAFIYAFVEALAAAGVAEGLPGAAATRLARGALRSAGAGIEGAEPLDALIARIASPGGTTRAGLDAMDADGGVKRAVEAAVQAAVRRAQSLSD